MEVVSVAGQASTRSAEDAARSSIEMWRLTVAAIPGAWIDEGDGAAAVFTGFAGSGDNGVWTVRPDVAPGVVAELLDRVEAAGVPHSLQLREGASPELTRVARERGMVLDAEEPVMLLDPPSSLAVPPAIPGLSITRLRRGEGGVHARIAAPAFGDRVDVFEAATSIALSVPDIRCYAGEIEGEPVVTARAVTHLGATAVFAVATVPEHRSRGYGSAVTARAVLDGFAAGGQWAWLQAAPDATRMYERLGFRAVETGAIWVRE
jgi:N-acetylglutamate synthase